MTVEELLARIDPFELSAWAVLAGVKADERKAEDERREQLADVKPGMDVHESGRRHDDYGNPIDDDDDDDDDDSDVDEIT